MATPEEATADASARLTRDVRTRWAEVSVLVDEVDLQLRVRAAGRGEWGAVTLDWFEAPGDDLDVDDVEEVVVAAALQLVSNCWPDDWHDRWPICPGHDHSLTPRVRRGRAMWCCPEGPAAIPVGQLPPQPAV